MLAFDLRSFAPKLAYEGNVIILAPPAPEKKVVTKIKLIIGFPGYLIYLFLYHLPISQPWWPVYPGCSALRLGRWLTGREAPVISEQAANLAAAAPGELLVDAALATSIPDKVDK